MDIFEKHIKSQLSPFRKLKKKALGVRLCGWGKKSPLQCGGCRGAPARLDPMLWTQAKVTADRR